MINQLYKDKLFVENELVRINDLVNIIHRSENILDPFSYSSVELVAKLKYKLDLETLQLIAVLNLVDTTIDYYERT